MLLFLLFGASLIEQNAYADGGQVTTSGVVGFYEESSSEPPISSTSESVTNSNSSEPLIAKPKGRLPSTGEIISNPFTWLGCLLAISAMGLFLWVKNKRQNGDED
ncbi:hypothetical protein RV15_GL002079 [Enterococcus silesiacus]|nr:LPXTG cell wall anchor domain-containing protein [Enterococcus silesiacus]OJG92945.1 hypothetical protein RV15_GL002079 [Enterococcus silesiacus]